MKALACILGWRILWVLPVILFSSCGKEDKELVAKRERQKHEISRLEAALVTVQAKLGEPVPDRSREVAEAEVKLAAIKAEIARVEDEVADLREKKRSLEKEFAEYRRKYSLSGGTGN